MATGRPISGHASRVGTATHALGDTTDSNPLDDRQDNVELANRGRGKRWGKLLAGPRGKGARANKGRKQSGGANLRGGAL